MRRILCFITAILLCVGCLSGCKGEDKKETSSEKYEQLEKNTVDAYGQLKDTRRVRFVNPEGKGKRIMILGNSMTLHEPNESIGWSGSYGMAASSEDKDYVHQLMNMVDAESKDNAYCIVQISEWETRYKNGEKALSRFATAQGFDADIIIFRAIENCPQSQYNESVFIEQLDKLLEYFNTTEKAKIILTTGFWRHPGDNSIVKYGNQKDYPVVKLGDLGELDEMKAIGLFENSGVANHPGDLGMRKMAERIFEEVKKII